MPETETVKTYQELNEVLDYVQTTHARMRAACARVAESDPSERIRTLMMSFADALSDLEQVLKTASAEQPAEVLETWVQYVPTRPVDVLVERGERVDELTWYDLAALSLQVQEEMVALYETLLEQVKAEPVQKVLETLAEAEREAGKKLSKKLLSLQEL